MINVSVHADGHRFEHDLPLDRVSELVGQQDQLLWLDVVDPTPADISHLGQEFGFHPLALEDATKPHQRPKIETYPGYLFIVFYVLEMREGTPCPVEMSLFVGSNYLVTVHRGTLPVIAETAELWSQNEHELGHRGIALLVYSLLDAIVDGYFPVIDGISERIEDLEEAIFTRFRIESQEAIFRLKKDLLAARRVLAPERDVMNVLVRRDSPIFGEETIVYFQDVYDHILRVTDAVDTYRDLLSSALDSYLSIASNRLNQIMKTLTAWSIILMSVTLVASIYGMNFDRMPELHWRFGYPYAIGLMLLIGIALYAFFRRKDWS